MNPRDNDEERLIRIERILEQLQKDSAAMKRVASKMIEAAADAAPSLASPATPPPMTARKN